MSLLPKSHQEFSKSHYWDRFFKKRGQKSFEWYGEFPELSSYLLKYIKPKDKVLIVGCGNSKLGVELYDAGYKNITNIDISSVVIKQMQTQYGSSRPGLIFKEMDATKMNFDGCQFSVVLDKGTLDALMPDNKEITVTVIDKYFNEINKVLSNFGRYMCISLLQEHILDKLIKSFVQLEYAFRIVRCHDAEAKAKEQDESSMPVFLTVATKFIKLANPILEIALIEDSLIRLDNSEDIKNAIVSIQESASLCSSLCKGSVASDGEVSLDLYKPGDKEPRYTIYVVDQMTTNKKKTYAALIVPQGREVDWLFSTQEGRQELLKSVNYNRLAIITLNRGQKFENLDEVKKELVDNIKTLAPSELVKTQIPILSIGSDVGRRKLCMEGESKISGPFIIEEIENNNEIFRRLIFLKNQFVVQSEAKLKLVKLNKESEYEVDCWFLACDHHLFMSAGVNVVVKNKIHSEILIIGLGGGGLCTFLHQLLPQMCVSVVEIDDSILDVATKYFGLHQNEKLKVSITDGLDFIKKSCSEEKKYDVILFDVDSKDTSVGMSCPPKEFVEYSFLEKVNNCLTNEGFFILNVVARNKILRDKVVADLKKIYKFVACYKISQDLNEIIFCSKNNVIFEEWKNTMKKSLKFINKEIKSKSSLKKDVLDILNLLNNFKLAE